MATAAPPSPLPSLTFLPSFSSVVCVSPSTADLGGSPAALCTFLFYVGRAERRVCVSDCLSGASRLAVAGRLASEPVSVVHRVGWCLKPQGTAARPALSPSTSPKPERVRVIHGPIPWLLLGAPTHSTAARAGCHRGRRQIVVDQKTMSFSSREYAQNNAKPQFKHFSEMGLKSSSFARSYDSPHDMWHLSRSSDANGSWHAPSSPSKSRRSGRRLSGEELRGESQMERPNQNAPNTYFPDFVQSNRADFSPNPSFRGDHSSEYPAGLNNPFFDERLHGGNSQRWCDRDDSSQISQSHESRWAKNEQAPHTWSPRVSSKRRSRSEKRRHRKGSRQNEISSSRSNASNSNGGPLKTPPSRNNSPDKWPKRHSSSPVKVFRDSNNSEQCNIADNSNDLSQFANTSSSSSKEDSKYSPDQNFVKKKKKKKKKNKRRKSKSQSEDSRRYSPEGLSNVREPSPKKSIARITPLSPSKVNINAVTGCLTPRGEKSPSHTKRGRDLSDTEDCNNSASSEAPDSYVCAIVKKRRTSRQDEEGSAILKFTRVEAQTRVSPRKSALAGLVKQSQAATPTSAKKKESSSAGNKAVTPLKEEKGDSIQRPSPTKVDIKPKAIIKPGLRSAKKTPKSSEKSRQRSKTPFKTDEDSSRKLVQRTLESYFSKSASPAAAEGTKAVSAGATGSASPAKGSADQRVPAKSHVRRIYSDDAKPAGEAPRAVIQLTPISESVISKLRPPQAEAAPRSRWGGSSARLAEVRPIPSPAKEAPSEAEPTKVAPARVTRAASLDTAAADLDLVHPEEDLAETQRDEAARQAEVTKAAQRNRKRHTRGLKVTAFCDVLQEDIERHPVQNEVPANKWSKWINPAQMRCLVSLMLDNVEICLKYSLEAERNEEWEDFWVKLTRRLNTMCFNALTKLNTGLRMTVLEWKTCWLDLKGTIQKRVNAMTAKERLHNLGTLDCLLYSEDLYRALIKSKGECLGDECPKIWCPGACVGVFCPTMPVKVRTTEE